MIAQPNNTFLSKIINSHLRNISEDICNTQDSSENGPDFYFEEVRLQHHNDPQQGAYIMPLVTLKTRPCRWAEHNGCSMCGFYHGATRKPATDKELIQQTQKAISRLDPKLYPVLVFTSNGSFFDPLEVSDHIRPILIDKLFSSGYKFIVTETRPDFLTKDRLEEISLLLHDKKSRIDQKIPFSISFGLESVNELILNFCINKGQAVSKYLSSLRLIQQFDFSFDCYILLGKTFLSAVEDVQDSITAIKFAVDNGADYVFVMVTNLMPGTLNAYLEQKGRYKLPSLWRAVTLLKSLPPSYRKHVLVKGIRHAPIQPIRYATTCPKCENVVRSKIDFWNLTGDFNHILDIPHCSCQDIFNTDEWQEDSYRPPLTEILLNQYSLLAEDFDTPLPADFFSLLALAQKESSFCAASTTRPYEAP